MRTAYVTTLCNGDAYAPGVEALGRSLEHVDSSEPRVVLVTPDVSDDTRDLLARQRWEVRDVTALDPPHGVGELLFRRFRHTFTKLQSWSLVDFDKLVVLDADTIVVKNIDELFDRPALAAAPDFLLPDRFNSGVMVVKPDAHTYAELMRALADQSDSYDGGDQGLLNTFYNDWYSMPVAHRLPAGFNMHQFIYQFMRAHPALSERAEQEARVIHYTVQKPWLVKTTLAGGSEKWWNMYFAAHPEQASDFKRRMHAMEDWGFDRALKTLLPA